MPTQSDLDPLHSAEQIHNQRICSPLNVLKQDRGTTFAHQPSRNLSYLQLGVNRYRHALKQTTRLKNAHERLHISESHAASLYRPLQTWSRSLSRPR